MRCASGLAAMLLGMSDIPPRAKLYGQRTPVLPGSIRGPKPKRYDKGRRCRCGAVLNAYTKGEWCNPCDQNPDRRDRYFGLPIPEDKMEPEKMKSRDAAAYLDVHARELRDLAAAGLITIHKLGRGLYGTTYDADSVRAYKASLVDKTATEADTPMLTSLTGAQVEDIHCNGGGPCEDPEGCGGAGKCRILPNYKDGCYAADGKCCDEPDDCRLAPTDPGEDDEVHPADENVRLLNEFGEQLSQHLRAVDEMHAASGAYRAHFSAAAEFGEAAWRVQVKLRERGVEVAAPPYGQPALLIEPVIETALEVRRQDAEIDAMLQISEALSDLGHDSRMRAIQWAIARFSLDTRSQNL